MADKERKPKIICHETKKGIKCKYEGPVYTMPPQPKPKKPKTSTM